ncbi:sulfatase [Rubritalea tangerina]|uniref:Sulfatase n=1 Tax=Rubritalea tangerina TaxID=430798 RepID=A0ABW4Z7K7_9BACT
MKLLFSLILFGLLNTVLCAKQQKMNVLFIAVDDLNDWVACLGNKQAITPNIDRLAAKGMLFTNASCAASVCNPSRAAVMSGLRPSTSGVYENATPLQTQIPASHLTLPKYFKKNGYITHGSGKIYHDQIGGHPHDDFDHYHFWNEHYRKWGWELGYSRYPDPEPQERPHAKITRLTKRNFDFAPIEGTESMMPDFLSTNYGVDFLNKNHHAPFFLAIGIFRPHLPWFAPQKYFDLYPIDNIQLPPTNPDDLNDLSAIALKRTNDKASKHNKVIALNEWKKAVQAYLACISFADAQIGRLLNALENSPYKDNTIIVLWSDHGYHLGEKDHWHKRTLWERSVRVPYIVVAPGTSKPGTKTDAPVDLMSVYPSLLELAGLP